VQLHQESVQTPLSTHPSADHKRYRELDSLRGFAALSVFFSHVVLASRITGSVYQKISMSPLHIFFDGTSAVLFFFVLSGFVLALPYIHNENRPVNLMSFYFKRLFRIYPAFAIAILAALTMKHFLYHPGNMGSYTTWLSDIWNWDMRSNRTQVLNTFSVIIYDYNTNLIDPVIWSLLVEVKVSLLLPFLIIIIRRNNFVFNGLLLVILLYLGLDFYIGTFYIGVVLAKYAPKAGEYIKKNDFPSHLVGSVGSHCIVHLAL
jgi:peptidoglycan/LPS O-acetylase OafA/YrhL